MQVLEVKLVGISPLLMHNGRLADPRNPIVQKMAEITDRKRGAQKKTEADYEKLAEYEFEGGLYWDNDANAPYVPAENIESAIASAASYGKRGNYLAGLVVETAVFTYEGPRDIGGLYNNRNHCDQRMVVVNRGRVLRTRPRFPKWGLDLVIQYDGIDTNDLLLTIEEAGRRGICDYTPKFGRFELVSPRPEQRVESKRKKTKDTTN